MSSEKYIFVAVVFAMAMSFGQSASVKPPRIVNIEEVVNRTVCPFKVEIEDNPDRVPRKIKMIKCAEQPNHYCRAQKIPDHECCHHKHYDHAMECVEVRDKALVFNKKKNMTELYDVTVGCTCMIASTGADFPGS